MNDPSNLPTAQGESSRKLMLRDAAGVKNSYFRDHQIRNFGPRMIFSGWTNAVSNFVSPVFHNGLPKQIGAAIIRRVSIIVGDLVLKAWSWAMKGFTNQAVNIKGLSYPTSAQVNCPVADTMPTALERSSGKSICYGVSSSPYSPLTADFVRPAFNRNPLFIHMLIYLVLVGPASASPQFTTRYDDSIQSSVRAYWPDFPDWLYWKAQLIQESRLDPNAVSPVGAMGIAQVMPKTWADITHELGWSGISANQADPAIEAGSYYMGKLRRMWNGRPRPILEQHYLGMAAYNAGAGNILKAQAVCSNSTFWSQISPCLKFVTGTLSQQTLDYVSRIQEWRRDLGP